MNYIVLKFRSLPEFFRMLLTAILGVLLGLITYEIVFFINPITPKAASSWMLAYVIGIVRQHSLHRWLTFNDKSNYWKSLLRAFIMYFGSLLITSGENWVLTEYFALHHRLAWGICIVSSSLISLILLKRFVFKKQV